MALIRTDVAKSCIEADEQRIVRKSGGIAWGCNERAM